MHSLRTQFNHPTYSDDLLNESIAAILDGNIILAMSTVQDGKSYINSAHFAYNERLELIIFTHPQSQHSVNLTQNPSIAIAVWTHPDMWARNLRGLQMFGTGALVPGDDLQEAIDIYATRFPPFAQLVRTPNDLRDEVTRMRLYAIRIERVKLIDEPRFGQRNWIVADVATTPELELFFAP